MADSGDFNFSNSHSDLMARDARHTMGWRYDPAIVFKAGRGTKLIDVEDNEYFDLTSGMMTMVLGHAHPELTETLKSQAELLVHQSSWYTNPWAIELAELLASTLPDGLEVVNFAVTGSEANEIAFRMALASTGRYDIASVIKGLHGGSLGVEAVTTIGGKRKMSLGPLMMPAAAPAILAPHCYRCPINLEYPSCDVACLATSEELMDHLTSQSVAGIIAETALAAGGMIVPPQEWWPRLAGIAKSWGALLIVDEVQMAPSRTGRMWGFENYDVTPDIITFGKGMSAGFGLCGTITTSEIAEHVRGTCGLPWAGTYSGDPFPAAVALKQLQIILRDGLTERAAQIGRFINQALMTRIAHFAPIGDIRGIGMYHMLDVVTDKKTKRPDPAMAERIRYNMMLNGVCTITLKNFIRFVPPLIITEAEVDDIVGRMEAAIRRAMDGLPRDIDFRASSSLAPNERRRTAA
jgi:4-aminobutyrate aminotransferase-like enzyme